MRHLKTLSICLATLALQSAAWAEIYETTDAQGNPEFTDSPPGPDAEVINLQQTNIIDAPPEEPQEVSAPQPAVDEQEPRQENQTVIIHDRDDDLDDMDEGYDDNLRRERAFNGIDPAAPREIGDSNSQMPDEVGDFDTPVREEADASDERVIREADDAHVQRRIAHPHVR